MTDPSDPIPLPHPVPLADQIPLPENKHLPGKNPRPDDGLLESVAARADSATETSTYQSNVAWLYGIRLFNYGFFWEAHEVLETVWNNAAPNSREKHLLQGVIQIANAQLKARLEQQNAAERLQQMAAVCISRAYPGSRSNTTNGVTAGTAEQDDLMGLASADMHISVARCSEANASIALKLL